MTNNEEKTSEVKISKDSIVKKNAESYFFWLFCNILLPLLPILVKIVTQYFSDTNGIEILESIELLYYTFFICIMLLYSVLSKECKRIFEIILSLMAFVVIVLNPILISFIYTGTLHANRIKVYSILIPALMIILVPFNEFLNKRSPQ